MRPKVGIFGLTGCAGEQIMILNCEEELLRITELLDITYFPTATSHNDLRGDLDIAFVEGSVTNTGDREELKKIRGRAGLLVAIGTCAAWGGIPAMKNEVARETYMRKIYNRKKLLFGSLPAAPLREFVDVDFSISGCPIEKKQFIAAVAQLVHGDVPVLPRYSVCAECKMRENECILLHHNKLCLGPITVGGCDARCPSLGVGCVGCRGPVDEVNISSESELLFGRGYDWVAIQNKLRTFSGNAEVVQQCQIKEMENACTA